MHKAPPPPFSLPLLEGSFSEVGCTPIPGGTGAVLSTSERWLFSTRVRERFSSVAVCTEEPDYVEAFYNHRRLHATIGNRRPARAWTDRTIPTFTALRNSQLVPCLLYTEGADRHVIRHSLI